MSPSSVEGGHQYHLAVVGFVRVMKQGTVAASGLAFTCLAFEFELRGWFGDATIEYSSCEQYFFP